jgi:hypothetical protein
MTGIEALALAKHGLKVTCHTWYAKDNPWDYAAWIEEGCIVNSPYESMSAYDATNAFLADLLNQEWETLE